MKKLLILISLLFIAITFVACGEDDNDNNDNDNSNNNPAYTYEEAENRTFSVMCSKIYSCEEGSDARTFFGNDERECVQNMKDNSESTEEDCVDYNASKAVECLNCMENLSCSEFFEDDSEDKYCNVCNEICKNDNKGE